MKKFAQYNFEEYAEARRWLSRNNFKNKGYLTEEPWASFFIESWKKDGFEARVMNILPFWQQVDLKTTEKPWQIDIAEPEI